MAGEPEIAVVVKTPLPDGTFQLRSLEGTEAVSQLFEFRLTLVSADVEVDFRKMIGQPVSVEVSLASGDLVRTFAGVVSRFGQKGLEGRYAVYEMELVPWLWLLSRSAGCDLFNETSTQDIVKEVLRRAPRSEFELVGSGWTDRLYCVQYRESDVNFIQRLLEEEGFYFFFEPSGEFHKMIVADGAQTAATSIDVKYSVATAHEETHTVKEFGKVQQLTPGEYEMVDFDYADPKLGEPVESVPSSVDLGSADNETKWYDFPGEFGKITGGDTGKLRERVKLRIAQEDSRAVAFRGKSGIFEMMPGHGIKLTEAYREDLDGDYLVTSVTHKLESTGGLEAGGGGGSSYENTFECVPDGIRFAPSRVAPKPRIRGVHSAIVKEAIDDQARVRVGFPWCKDKVSCWIRVAQTLAGGGWGAQFHPRVGHEVVVGFYEGDPDLPIIVGRVYNGENEGPYSDKHSRGGVKTRSMDGNPDNFNEIRFEDEKGAEEILIHAEKDQTIEVENDEAKDIGGNRMEQVKKNVTIKIGGDRSETVDGARNLSVGGNKTEAVTGEKNISVTKGHTENITEAMKLDVGKDTNVTVGKSLTVAATEAVSLSAGKALSVSAGEDTSVAGKGAMTITVDKGGKMSIKEEFGLEAKKIQIEAKDEIVIKVGSASITMKSSGDITLDGGKIGVKGSGDVTFKGSKIAAN
ncbi:MAG: type VI secretion system tip protein TssI/VgrG [bacterium]